MRVMMAEKPLAVFEQIPNNKNVYSQDDQQQQRVASSPRLRSPAMQQLVNFDWNEKSRLPDRQPTGPAYPKQQPNPFHQRKQAIDQRARSGPKDLRLTQ